MAVDVEELIILPFRELVEKGNEAVENGKAAEGEDAELSKRMTKASRSIVKEGERALKRLQPLWDSQVEKYGDAFKAAMSQNDELEAKRRKLDDLLYDFEDYTEIESFDEERFTDLQSTAKSFALDVIDIIKRLKIDGLPIPPPPKETVFPPLPPLPPLPPTRPASRSSSKTAGPGAQRRASSKEGFHEQRAESPVHSPVQQTQRLSNGSAGGNMKTKRRLTPHIIRSDTKVSRASAASVDPLPPYSRQEHIHPPEHDDIHLPLQIPNHSSPQSPSRVLGRQRRCSGPDVLGEEGNQVRLVDEPASSRTGQPSALDIPSFPLPRTTAWVSDQAAVPAPLRMRNVPVRETIREAIPEHEAVANDINFDSPLSPIVFKLGQFPIEREMAKGPGPRQDNETGASTSSGSRVSALSNANSTAPSVSPSPTVVVALNGTVPDSGERSSSLNARKPSLPSGAEFDGGLMLAEDWTTVVSDSSNSVGRQQGMTREPDCNIGSKSSLFQMKGFCGGAQAFRKGGHWQGVKKTSGYVAGATTQIGRCISCGYAHNYEELSLDVDRNAAANFSICGVRFRVRFLYKSHLAAVKMSEAYYGCLFCAQTGCVTHEGDATVFATSDQLFRHLARHPQPLPEVPGLTVLYGALSDNKTPSTAAPIHRPTTSSSTAPGYHPNRHLNDFDLHFPNPPKTGSGIPPTSASEIARLPTATALKDHIQRIGEKKLQRPDGTAGTNVDLLLFFVGARIVGVEFPARWAGKWATGWHDGVWGVFPVKLAEIERPRRGEIPPLLQTGSHSSRESDASGRTTPASSSPAHAMGSVQVQTRWKWDPKDATDKGWLVFDKGETIANVGWLYKDHWCWSGMNAKGRFGVFPRSHVKIETVREKEADGRLDTRSSSRKKGTTSRPAGFWGRARRVSSSAASSISGGSGVIEIIP